MTDSPEFALQEILDNKLLQSVYQPVISLKHRCIHAWEALSRGPLHSPLHNPVPLFAAARQQGRLVELEKLSREQAISGFARQKLKGCLFLNISPDVLIQPDHTPGMTLDLLQRFELDPTQVVIELTEQHPIQDFTLMRDAISHYRTMGFRIALDDLGSGYSGLRAWSELRPDFVKVDQHFVRQCDSDKVKQDFLHFICNIASALDTEVIAEGVETREEMQTLQSLGLDYLQGYYFARPQAKPDPLPLDNLLDSQAYNEKSRHAGWFSKRLQHAYYCSG